MKKQQKGIPHYIDFISPKFLNQWISQAKPISEDEDLKILGDPKGLETPEALLFLRDLYMDVRQDLARVLELRAKDRSFLDSRIRTMDKLNKRAKIPYHSKEYLTPIGLKDSENRLVFGPHSSSFLEKQGDPVAPYPEEWGGPQVTLFGPPDSASLSINAMNAIHRRLPHEPSIVEELLSRSDIRPRWGADLEDSKTPLHEDMVSAAENLTACIRGDLEYKDPKNGKEYHLADTRRSLPIKRFPGLALPCPFLFYKGEPLPLHLYDFALHLFHNWDHPDGLIFYVPKLESEEEAAYIASMIGHAEDRLKSLHPQYKKGSVRIMVVLENPRAVFRIHEIMDALYPYFLGASLGWHDYLGSTARLFREDSQYRIPVKADPNIVIKHIKASHELVAKAVGGRGGITVGGMYGVLPLDRDWQSPSFQITLKGYFKDTLIQLKRNLSGFWVAHPDFVRLGIAIVTAWKDYQEGDSLSLSTLVRALLQKNYAEEVIAFVESDDIPGLSSSDPLYPRRLIVADLGESDTIANNDPEEIRYNVFQSLQYLTDWLRGNGCVALPALIEGQPVRVMDDLATAERSRWEVWHEIYHGRFSIDDFLKIALEEYQFIKEDLSNEKKIVQVKWNKETSLWYPIALRLMIQLMTDPNPVEFATELLLPLTLSSVRDEKDPLEALMALDEDKYKLQPKIERWLYAFKQCGSYSFADTMSVLPLGDSSVAKKAILSFTEPQIIEAASHHGDIGSSPLNLDPKAEKEQSLVKLSSEELRQKLFTKGQLYKDRFGFKYLVSAQGKTGSQLLDNLEKRIDSSKDNELIAAREALAKITIKRVKSDPLDPTLDEIETLRKEYGITGISLAVTDGKGIQTWSSGLVSPEGETLQSETLFDIASLSKTLGTAFTLELLKKKGIEPETLVKDVLRDWGSPVELKSPQNPSWINELQITHLMNHSALNMHYVNPINPEKAPKSVIEILTSPELYGYDQIEIIGKPGKEFHYSGGGFLLLEHLVELIGGASIEEQTKPFLEKMGLKNLHMTRGLTDSSSRALGVNDDGSVVSNKPFWFPLFAAGMLASPSGLLTFLNHLTIAYHSLSGSGGISHDTAVRMLHGEDRGSREFMGLDMGLGTFIGEAGENRLVLHQGANEGYRALYLSCFKGPDRGKGVVIFSNGDNKSVPLIARAAQKIVQTLSFKGIDFTSFQSQFKWENITQEEIVNTGYKELLFKHFQRDLPESISPSGPLDPLMEFNLLKNARIIEVSDQSFGRSENLISSRVPQFDPSLFGKQGKIMDSWETARHNPTGRDILIVEIKEPKQVSYIQLSTRYHQGNQCQSVSIEGRQDGTSLWEPILPKTMAEGHSLLNVKLDKDYGPFSQFRISQFPDGGLTRVALFDQLPPIFPSLEENLGKWIPFGEGIPKAKKNPAIEAAHFKAVYPSEDLSCVSNGGRLISVSNEHFGPAEAVLSPFPPLNMFDGFESARSRGENHFEELIIELARESALSHILLDFTYFRHNNPQKIRLLGRTNGDWLLLVERDTKAYAGNRMILPITGKEVFDQIKLVFLPDGGLNRIRIFSADSMSNYLIIEGDMNV